MKILKGQVKYKGRDDYQVVYGTTDDGRTYYFLDDEVLPNKARIGSTELIEAVDKTIKPSKIGLLGEDGKEIIPFVNKTIKTIGDGILLVEKSTPESENVKETIALRSDPKAATKLVATPAAIKDKMASVMTKDARYVFNDLFSEAYICDLNGKPLVDGAYSFIAVDNATNKIYLSKNNTEDEIVEYSMIPSKVTENEVPKEDKLDVTNVNIPKDTIEKALNAEVTTPQTTPITAPVATPVESLESTTTPVTIPTELTTPVTTPVEETTPETVPVTTSETEPVTTPETVPVTEPVTTPVTEPITTPTEETTPETVPVTQPETEPITTPVTTPETTPVTEPVTTPVKEEKETLGSIKVVPPREDIIPALPNIEADDVKEEVKPAPITPEEVAEKVGEHPLKEIDATPIDIEEDEVEKTTPIEEKEEIKNIFEEEPKEEEESKEETPIDDINLDVFKDDKQEDEVQSDYFDIAPSTQPEKADTVIEDGAKLMTKLMEQNRKQQELITKYREGLKKAAIMRNDSIKKDKEQNELIRELSSKVRSLENTNTKYEARMQIYESKVHEQEGVINEQRRELDFMRPQLEGKEELAKVLRDAKALLGDEQEDYTEESSYRRAA